MGSPGFTWRPPSTSRMAATIFSGIPAFIELIDIDALLGLHDPLKGRIEQLLG